MRSILSRNAIPGLQHINYMASAASSSSSAFFSTSISKFTYTSASSSHSYPRYPNARLSPHNDSAWLARVQNKSRQDKDDKTKEDELDKSEGSDKAFSKMSKQIEKNRKSRTAPELDIPVNWHLLEVGMLSIYIPPSKYSYVGNHTTRFSKMSAHLKCLAWPLVVYSKKLIIGLPVKIVDVLEKSIVTFKAFRDKFSRKLSPIETMNEKSLYELSGRIYYKKLFIALRSKMYTALSSRYVLSKNGTKLPMRTLVMSSSSRKSSLATDLANTYQSFLRAQFRNDHVTVQDSSWITFSKPIISEMASKKLKDGKLEISLQSNPKIVCARHLYQEEGPDGTPSLVQQVVLKVASKQRLQSSHINLDERDVLEYVLFQRRDSHKWKILNYVYEDQVGQTHCLLVDIDSDHHLVKQESCILDEKIQSYELNSPVL